MPKLLFTLLFISIISISFSQVTENSNNNNSNSAYIKQVLSLVIDKLENGDYSSVIDETDLAIKVFKNKADKQNLSQLFYYRGVAKSNLQNYKGAIEDLNISIGENSNLPKQAIVNINRKINEYKQLLTEQNKRLKAVEDSIASVEIDADIEVDVSTVNNANSDVNSSELSNNIIEIFDISAVNIKPEYPGSDLAMYDFVQANIKYPYQSAYDTIYGIVNVGFVIDTNGAATDIKIEKGLDEYCNNEALRLVNGMPNWKPGVKNGKNVKVYNTLPLYFDINSYLIDSVEINKFSKLITDKLDKEQHAVVIEDLEKIIYIIENKSKNKSAAIFYYYRSEAKVSLNDYQGAISDLKLAISTNKDIPKEGLIIIEKKLKQYQDILQYEAELLEAKNDSLILLASYPEIEEKPIDKITIDSIEYSIISISSLVGDTIDLNEKLKHKLFPQFDRRIFNYAIYLKDKDSNVYLHVNKKGNTSEMFLYSYEQMISDGGKILYVENKPLGVNKNLVRIENHTLGKENRFKIIDYKSGIERLLDKGDLFSFVLKSDNNQKNYKKSRLISISDEIDPILLFRNNSEEGIITSVRLSEIKYMKIARLNNLPMLIVTSIFIGQNTILSLLSIAAGSPLAVIECLAPLALYSYGIHKQKIDLDNSRIILEVR